MSDAPRIIEGGHYYQSKGPTIWSSIGWEIAHNRIRPGDKTLLFIDDVHPLVQVSEHELNHPAITDFHPCADFTVLESAVHESAMLVLKRLRGLTRRHRARQHRNGTWFFKEFPLTDLYGQPLCVLLDAGLTLQKRSLGFRNGINVLPWFYSAEQTNLLRIARRAISDFQLEVVLYDLEGLWETIQS